MAAKGPSPEVEEFARIILAGTANRIEPATSHSVALAMISAGIEFLRAVHGVVTVAELLSRMETDYVEQVLAERAKGRGRGG